MSAFDQWRHNHEVEQGGIEHLGDWVTRKQKAAWNAALDRVAQQLRDAGATLPAPEATGTIEGSMLTGLCIALVVVEDTRVAREESNG